MFVSACLKLAYRYIRFFMDSGYVLRTFRNDGFCVLVPCPFFVQSGKMILVHRVYRDRVTPLSAAFATTIGGILNSGFTHREPTTQQ